MKNAPGKHFRKGISLVKLMRMFPDDEIAEKKDAVQMTYSVLIVTPQNTSTKFLACALCDTYLLLIFIGLNGWDFIWSTHKEIEMSVGQFQIYVGNDNEFWWRFRVHGRIVAVSGEGHKTIQECHNEINLIKQYSPDAPVEEPSLMAQALAIKARNRSIISF